MMPNEDMASSIKAMMADLENFSQFMLIKARLCREYYVSLVDEGFTEEEALNLCKHFKLGE